MTTLWVLYLLTADLLTDLARAAGRRHRQLRVHPERGDMNISKAIYAAVAVALGAIVVAAITAAVNNRVAGIQ